MLLVRRLPPKCEYPRQTWTHPCLRSAESSIASRSVLAIPRASLDGLTPFQQLSDFHRVAIHHGGHDCPNGQAVLLHRVRLSVMADRQDQHVAVPVDARGFDGREVRVRLQARGDGSTVVPDSNRVCPLEH